MVTQDYLTIGSRWFGLPEFSDLVKEVKAIYSSGRIKPRLDFKVYKNGILSEPEVVEYNELIPAITDNGFGCISAMYGERNIPGGKND